LLDQNVISDARIFSAAAAVKSLRGANLKPGEYKFLPGMTMREVLALLNSGRVLTYKVTIPEGWTTQMAFARIGEDPVLTGPLPELPPEGSIMADTFIFPRGTTRQDIVSQMVEAQTELLEKLWAARPANFMLKTKAELVTLASIVEKETAKSDERPLVASVFLNRLKQGMRLQSDPTIIYGLVGGTGKLDRPITRADIDMQTPYNTYQIDGLPPGPIGNPGKAALEAVLNPAHAQYLYFVADGTGGHSFASTLEEHNSNVAKWRQVEAGTAPAVAPQQDQVAETSKQTTASSATSTGLDQLQLEPEQVPGETTSSPPASATSEPSQLAAPDGAAVAPDEAPLDVKPGSVMRVGDRLVPIPAPKPK
jgi:UPF0755 protein